MLKEDSQERRHFDAVTAELHGGDTLSAVQTALSMWARQAPPNGSYGCMLAIFANEVEKARQRMTPNVANNRIDPAQATQQDEPAVRRGNSG